MRAPSYVLPEWVLKGDKGETNLQPLRARQARVAANYFKVLGIPLLQGRVFGPEDRKETIPVAIVSQSAARKFWPTASPLGKQLRNSDMEEWLTVVGVVGDVRDDGLDQPPVPRVYWAASQQSVAKGEVILRTSMDMRALMPVIRERIRSVDSSCFIRGPWSLSHVVRDSIWRVNYSMLLLVGLAGLSLILALVGIYGVLSWTVRERLREIGLRMALGADRLQVLWLVVRQGLMIVLMGIALGLMMATGLTRYLQSLLFGVEPTDWITFLLVSLSVLITALVASYIPAYRATRVDPMRALRCE
jgi:putative ABC transport system permease protein